MLQSLCWKAKTFSTGRSRTGQYQANATSKIPKSSFEQNLILTEMQSNKELWSDNTHVIGFDREYFPTFWGGVNRIMKFGECVTTAKSDGCYVRNLIQEWLLQTLPFTRNLTLTSNPLLGNGLQNQSRKSIHSQRIFEGYWNLYI